MPAEVSHPGVFIEEISLGRREIAARSTSTAAFVDVFRMGPVDRPVLVTSMAEFTRIFDGLDDRSEASYGVSQFFANGGQRAWIVRLVPDGATTASCTFGGITFETSSPGAWGDSIAVSTAVATDGTIDVNIAQNFWRHGDFVTERSEDFSLLTVDGGPRNLRDVINGESELIRVVAVASGGDLDNPAGMWCSGGSDGFDGRSAALSVVAAQLSRSDDAAPLFTLAQTSSEVFNLLCLPATAFMNGVDRATILSIAARFCERQRAFFVVDGPHDARPAEFESAVAPQLEHLGENAALWCPSVIIEKWDDERSLASRFWRHAEIVEGPLTSAEQNGPRVVATSGSMAGVIARTDANRGVWKAPAGTEAVLRGVTPQFAVSDIESASLKTVGLNAVRTLPGRGTVSWGARTLRGADEMAGPWKYVSVRRTALHIERSVDAGTKWAVFEPNDEPLWAQLRQGVNGFMESLFRQGAFTGDSSRDAYFVRCDRSTTTPMDIDRGVVNIEIGFAPLKPAEFVIVRIAQTAAS